MNRSFRTAASLSPRGEEHPRRVILSVEVTGKCNLCCLHCIAGSSPMAPQLPFARNEAILRELAVHFDEVFLNFKGGEPLVATGFRALLRQAVEAGFKTSVTTNGTLLTPKFLEEVRAVQTVKTLTHVKFYVSLDGPDAESNDAIRGPGTFRRITQGMSRLRAAGIRFSLSTVATRRNSHRLVEMAHFAREAGADLLQVVNLQPLGRGSDLSDDLISQDDFGAISQRLASILTPVATLYDESVLFGCDRRASYRVLRDESDTDAIPRAFTVTWLGIVLISHARIAVGHLRGSARLGELIAAAQRDDIVRGRYDDWLLAKQQATKQLCARLGLN